MEHIIPHIICLAVLNFLWISKQKIALPENNLIAWYPFNGNANDQSAQENHGTVIGPTLFSDRFNKPQSAYSFNGIKDLIDVKLIKAIDYDDELTVAFWAKFNGFPANQWTFILQKGSCSDSSPISRDFVSWWYLDYGFDHLFLFYWVDSHDRIYEIRTDQIFDENWNLQTHVLDRKNQISLVYQNGSLIRNKSDNFSKIQNKGNRLLIGQGQGESASGFKGALDDIRIQNKSLSQEEIWLLQKENNYSYSEDKMNCAIKIWNYSFHLNILPMASYENNVHRFEINEDSAFDFSSICEISRKIQIVSEKDAKKAEIIGTKQENNMLQFSILQENILNSEQCLFQNIGNELNVTCFFSIDYGFETTPEMTYQFYQNFQQNSSTNSIRSIGIQPIQNNQFYCRIRECGNASIIIPARLCTRAQCTEFNNLRKYFKQKETIYLKLEIPNQSEEIVPTDVFFVDQDYSTNPRDMHKILQLAPRSKYYIEKAQTIVQVELALPSRSAFFFITWKLNSKTDDFIVFFYPNQLVIPLDESLTLNWKNIWIPIVWLVGNSLFGIIVYLVYERCKKIKFNKTK